MLRRSDVLLIQRVFCRNLWQETAFFVVFGDIVPAFLIKLQEAIKNLHRACSSQACFTAAAVNFDGCALKLG